MHKILAIIFLIIMLPIIIVVSVGILICMGKPVIFKQNRVGVNNKIFTLYKFRSMASRNEKKGDPMSDEYRITSLGKLLRSTSIDEIPSLFNVIMGEMSLVGPRPLLPEYIPRYTEYQARRHEVKPGITGWAQIKGRNALTWEERFVLDVWYVDNRKWFLDIKIIFITIFKVLKREGISQPGHATMKEFMGSEHS